MKLINLTPSAVRVFCAQGEQVIPPSGILARVSVSQTYLETIQGAPVFRNSFHGVFDIPAPETGKRFIVSGLVLAALRATGQHRDDLLCPATGNRDGVVKDRFGKLRGITRFRTM